MHGVVCVRSGAGVARPKIRYPVYVRARARAVILSCDAGTRRVSSTTKMALYTHNTYNIMPNFTPRTSPPVPGISPRPIQYYCSAKNGVGGRGKREEIICTHAHDDNIPGETKFEHTIQTTRPYLNNLIE